MGDDAGRSPKPPEWLPDGWIMKVKTRSGGKVDRYYVSPVSGCTFRSRPEVMRHLNVEKVDAVPLVAPAFFEEDDRSVKKVDGLSPVTTACPKDESCDVEQVENSPLGLPSGWIQEIKTYKNGANAGKKYKCYVNPLTGSRFYTKAEVFRYLKIGNDCKSTLKRKKNAETKERDFCSSKSNQRSINADSKGDAESYLKTGNNRKSTLKRKKLTNAETKERDFCSSKSNRKCINANSEGDIQSLIESSPKGLPPGWIKEVKCKKNASGLRKDPYYIDPVNGYVFRSMKDALRYIETGERSKYAFKPKSTRSDDKMHAMENEFPPPISAKKLKGQGSGVKRQLFAGKVRKSSRKTKKESDEVLINSCSAREDQALLKYEQGTGPSFKALSGTVCLEDEQVKVLDQTQDKIKNGNELPDKPLEPAEKEALDQVIEKLLDSVSKSAPGSSDGKLPDPVPEHITSPLYMGLLESMRPADNILSQSSEPVDDPVQPQHGKLLEPEGKFVGDDLSDPNELSKLARGKASGQGIEETKKEGKNSATGSTQPRQSRAKSAKSVPITRRASKRLAGLEADPAADIEIGDKSLMRGKQSTRAKPSSARTFVDTNHETEAETPRVKDEPLGKQVEAETPKHKDATLGEHVDSEEQGGGDGTAYDNSECPMASPFGDSWPDPCIEFAFKTLTGQIPVLDTTTIQDFLHEQVPSVQASTLDGPDSALGGCTNGQDQADIQMQVNSAGKNYTLSATPESPSTSGRVKRLCRRR